MDIRNNRTVFRTAGTDGHYGIGKRRTSDSLWTKDHTYTEKPSDGEIHTPVSRFDQSSGAWLTGIKIRRGCGYGGESVHIRYYQYVCRCVQDHQYSCSHLVSEIRDLQLVLMVLAAIFILVYKTCTEEYACMRRLKNRRAVSRASGHVPETLAQYPYDSQPRQGEVYGETIRRIYQATAIKAMEKTNFYDAVYSPVILILNAVVVAVVMLFSASGNAKGPYTVWYVSRYSSSSY